MSYARWSDGDVYVYKHCGGWYQIHVTDRRDFQFLDPGECADMLVTLRVEGFDVPQDAIDALREEHAQDGKP